MDHPDFIVCSFMENSFGLKKIRLRSAFPGLKIIKLEYSLKLKIKRKDWLSRPCVRKQQIVALYFEFENELKFYSLEARANQYYDFHHEGSLGLDYHLSEQ